MGEETPTRVVGYHRAGSMQATKAGKREWGEMRQLRWVAGTWSDGRQDGESVRCLGYGLDGIYLSYIPRTKCPDKPFSFN
jgi:hypothetical protein